MCEKHKDVCEMLSVEMCECTHPSMPSSHFRLPKEGFRKCPVLGFQKWWVSYFQKAGGWQGLRGEKESQLFLLVLECHHHAQFLPIHMSYTKKKKKKKHNNGFKCNFSWKLYTLWQVWFTQENHICNVLPASWKMHVFPQQLPLWRKQVMISLSER